MNRQKDRDEAIRWARDTLTPGRNIIILDSETSNMYGLVIELAMINLSGDPVFNSRIRLPEGYQIAPGAQAVHGISMEDIKNAPSFTEVYPTIADILARAELVLIYNAAYDVERLDHTRRAHELPQFCYYPRRCLMLEYAQFYGQWNDYHQSYTWQKLTGGDHSALGDCRAALARLREMAEAKLTANPL